MWLVWTTCAELTWIRMVMVGVVMRSVMLDRHQCAVVSLGLTAVTGIEDVHIVIIGIRNDLHWLCQRVVQRRALAVSADKSVLHLIELLLGVCSKYEDCTYPLENPNGNLQYRPYMVRLLGSLIYVDYCSYGHWYQKTTNFWTDVDWSPCGNTGNGRCNNGECKMGPKKSKGRFRHTYALGQCSSRERGGRGRKARRIMVPGLLHQEMLRSMI